MDSAVIVSIYLSDTRSQAGLGIFALRCVRLREASNVIRSSYIVVL